MALITDPDNLVRNTEVTFNTTTRTITLSDSASGTNLSTDGVTLQALYSFTKERWKNDSDLIRYPFPFEAITSEQFEFKDGWEPGDTNTVNLIRNAGFAIKDSAGVSKAEYAGVITLGTIGAADQVYYQQDSANAASSNIVLTGAVNQPIKIYGDSDNGNVNSKGYLKLFVREQGKTYAAADLDDIGVSNMTYQAYRFPLANADDLKITDSDGAMDALGVSVTYYDSAQLFDIGGTNYPFNVVIDANSQTLANAYSAIQYQLRQDSDIDAGAGTVIGKTADGLLRFVGDTLVTSAGVYVNNIQETQINNIELYDDSDNKRTFPFVAAGTIIFNANLTNDSDAIYKMFYSTGFGTDSAELVQNNSNVDIAGAITGSTVSFTYDYDGDSAGGGAGVDKDVTLVAIGLGTAQYVVATGTITRSNANSISLVSSLERNYQNQD